MHDDWQLPYVLESAWTGVSVAIIYPAEEFEKVWAWHAGYSAINTHGWRLKKMGGLRNASTSICLTPWKVRMLTVAPTCDGFLCHHAQLFGVCLAL